MSYNLPIAPMKHPSTLRGKDNGKLPDNLLTTIGIGNARMEKTAARSFIAMFDEARRVLGIQIKEVGDYRSFEAQKNLFTTRYMPVDKLVFDQAPRDRKKIWEQAPQYGYNSVFWVKKRVNGSYLATAASPGNSNHGWGLALDVAEEYDNDTAPDPIREKFIQWLIANAARYGISAELQSEPWHWRYVAGDDIPLATQLYEKNGSVNPPAPAPSYPYPGSPLKLGSKGESVKLVQAKVGAKQDGDFGQATEKRVKSWQTKNKLLSDGIVGRVTWQKMFG